MAQQQVIPVLFDIKGNSAGVTSALNATGKSLTDITGKLGVMPKQLDAAGKSAAAASVQLEKMARAQNLAAVRQIQGMRDLNTVAYQGLSTVSTRLGRLVGGAGMLASVTAIINRIGRAEDLSARAGQKGISYNQMAMLERAQQSNTKLLDTINESFKQFYDNGVLNFERLNYHYLKYERILEGAGVLSAAQLGGMTAEQRFALAAGKGAGLAEALGVPTASAVSAYVPVGDTIAKVLSDTFGAQSEFGKFAREGANWIARNPEIVSSLVSGLGSLFALTAVGSMGRYASGQFTEYRKQTSDIETRRYELKRLSSLGKSTIGIGALAELNSSNPEYLQELRSKGLISQGLTEKPGFLSSAWSALRYGQIGALGIDKDKIPAVTELLSKAKDIHWSPILNAIAAKKLGSERPELPYVNNTQEYYLAEKLQKSWDARAQEALRGINPAKLILQHLYKGNSELSKLGKLVPPLPFTGFTEEEKRTYSIYGKPSEYNELIKLIERAKNPYQKAQLQSMLENKHRYKPVEEDAFKRYEFESKNIGKINDLIAKLGATAGKSVTPMTAFVGSTVNLGKNIASVANAAVSAGSALLGWVGAATAVVGAFIMAKQVGDNLGKAMAENDTWNDFFAWLDKSPLKYIHPSLLLINELAGPGIDENLRKNMKAVEEYSKSISAQTKAIRSAEESIARTNEARQQYKKKSWIDSYSGTELEELKLDEFYALERTVEDTNKWIEIIRANMRKSGTSQSDMLNYSIDLANAETLLAEKTAARFEAEKERDAIIKRRTADLEKALAGAEAARGLEEIRAKDVYLKSLTPEQRFDQAWLDRYNAEMDMDIAEYQAQESGVDDPELIARLEEATRLYAAADAAWADAQRSYDDFIEQRNERTRREAEKAEEDRLKNTFVQFFKTSTIADALAASGQYMGTTLVVKTIEEKSLEELRKQTEQLGKIAQFTSILSQPI